MIYKVSIRCGFIECGTWIVYVVDDSGSVSIRCGFIECGTLPRRTGVVAWGDEDRGGQPPREDRLCDDMLIFTTRVVAGQRCRANSASTCAG